MCQRLSMATTAAMIEPGRSGLVTGHEFAATQGSGEFDAEPLDDPCLLYTSDAADERSSVDLGGRRINKKKKQRQLADGI